MAYEFSEGPIRTKLTIPQIGNVIKEVGQERRFMSFIRRLGTSAASNSQYGAFAPTQDHDPFASAGLQADWRVGWRWANSVTNSMGMTLNQGYQVIFEVFEEQTSRLVGAKASGSAERREVERFVQAVFDGL